MYISLVCVAVFGAQVAFSARGNEQELYCAACKVVFDEVEYAISKVDPTKTIQIEGFRVDPKGNQHSKSIPYARSETHLTEVAENLCGEMNKYAQSKDKDSGKINFVRTDSRDDSTVKLENVSMSGEISNKLRYVCESILEEHEEDIISYFKKNKKSSFQKFCRNLGLCKKNERSDL